MKFKYSLCAVMSGILWGTISLMLKPLYSMGFTAVQVMLIRSFFSSIMLLVFLLIKNRELLKFQIKDIWIFLGTGVVSLTFFSFCYFTTIIESGSSIAVVLLYTSPIFVLLMSMILFKEKLTWQKGIAVILMFCGCVLVAGLIGSENKMSVKGLIIGLLSGLGYALYSIFSRYGLKKYNSLTITFYTFVFSCISTLPFSQPQKIIPLFNWKAALLLLGISFFSTVLPYILYTYSLSGIETGKAAILVTVEILMGSLIGIFVWKEETNWLKLLGMAIMIASIVLLELPLRKPRPKED